jgi:hypothetical protein
MPDPGSAPSEALDYQLRNQTKVPCVGRRHGEAEFESGSADRQIRQRDARPCRLHLAVDLSGTEGDAYGHGMNWHSSQQIIEKLLPPSTTLRR